MPSDKDPATAQLHAEICTEQLSHYKRMHQYKNHLQLILASDIML